MATAMCSSLCVSTPTMTSWRWSAMLGMIVDPFTWSMVRLAGQAGRTGLRWDLVDQAPIRSLPTWPARHYGAARVLAPAGKQYDVCLFPERAEEQSPHVPRKTGNVLTAAWPIAINVLVACRPTSGTTSSLPEGIHRHLGPRPRSNAPSQSLPRTEQAPHAVPSPVDLANATCSVQTDPTAVCVPS